MRHISLPIIAVSFALLSACASTARVSDTIGGIVLTASGTLNELSSKGMQAVEPIVETANDVHRRAQNIKEGFDKMTDGKQQVEDSLKP